MKIVKVQFAPWDKSYNFSYENEDIKVGDYVVVETKLGIELAKVIAFDEMNDTLAPGADPIKPISHKASKEDLDCVLEQNRQKDRVFKKCVGLIKKNELPIKLVDVHCSLDDTRLTFAFIADGRVDFRELLKDLNKEFKKSIRLQQIGIRDEIKINGDIGCCGMNLCCQGFYKELGNVTSELAALQQVAHRGSERLSGVCGRLKCCLTFEEKLYNELADNLPMIGEKVKTAHGAGEVIGWHVLKQTVDVLLEDNTTIVEMPIVK
ncbi:MAG: PSP1 domain protein [Parcubacteria group bacterium GW2011_GWC2_39_14]|nr:MAG: PSP1 domain protein [Parcubacteria group bacterium GW2011_GWC2_39_14]KKR55140.1 MAG: PSP1 domain protein [Parcubacteria group bacterium GW2011_GWA2_40_23]